MTNSKQITITLPMPPSVNQAYAGKARRFKSKQYKDWEKLCTTYPQKKHTFKYTGKGLELHYKFFSKWYNKDESVKKKDVSNYVKLTEDMLCKIIDGLDDKYVWKFSAEKIHSGREEVEVTIEELQ